MDNINVIHYWDQQHDDDDYEEGGRPVFFFFRKSPRAYESPCLSETASTLFMPGGNQRKKETDAKNPQK